MWSIGVLLLVGGAPTAPLFGQQCTSFVFQPANATFDQFANASSITVSKTPAGTGVYTGCPWTATSNASWITIQSGGSSDGGGHGVVQYSIGQNTGAQRSGTILFSSGPSANASYTITQLSGHPVGAGHHYHVRRRRFTGRQVGVGCHYGGA